MEQLKFNHGQVKTALIFLMALAFSCEGIKAPAKNEENRTPFNDAPDEGARDEPDTNDEWVKVCPASKKNALEAGRFFEYDLSRHRVIKPWGSHSHDFDEL